MVSAGSSQNIMESTVAKEILHDERKKNGRGERKLD